MKLYHTTKIENIESIESFGIWSAKSNKNTNATDTLQDLFGIYGFNNIESAKEFGFDQNEEFAIFEIETDELILVDPEYNGEAFFIETEDDVDATLIFTSEI